MTLVDRLGVFDLGLVGVEGGFEGGVGPGVVVDVVVGFGSLVVSCGSGQDGIAIGGGEMLVSVNFMVGVVGGVRLS